MARVRLAKKEDGLQPPQILEARERPPDHSVPDGPSMSRPIPRRVGRPVVVVSGCQKVYEGKTAALREVSMTVHAGEWVTIVGPSGSGKTTLLNIIGSLDQPSAGQVRVGGKDLARLDAADLADFRSRTVGFVFQRYYLIPYLSVEENVLLAQHFAGVDDPQAARTILRKLGLGHRLGHLPHQLSGGEQQRVCIARAVVNRPSVLLCDEPTGNLDGESSRKVFDAFRRLHARGTTIILVTHQEGYAAAGDRSIRLVDGRITDDGRSAPGRDGPASTP